VDKKKDSSIKIEKFVL